MRNENEKETAALKNILKALKFGKAFKGGATLALIARNGKLWAAYHEGPKEYALNIEGLTMALMKNFRMLPSQFMARFKMV